MFIINGVIYALGILALIYSVDFFKNGAKYFKAKLNELEKINKFKRAKALLNLLKFK